MYINIMNSTITITLNSMYIWHSNSRHVYTLEHSKEWKYKQEIKIEIIVGQ